MLNEKIMLAFIGGLPATIAAIAAMIVSIKNAKQIVKIEVATNSMKDALVAATKSEAFAAGIKQGGMEEKVKTAEADSVAQAALDALTEGIKQGTAAEAARTQKPM